MLPLLFLLGSAVAQTSQTPVDRCGCGYYDATTGQTFTESIIVYFNETTNLSPDVWSVREYINKKEKGHSAVYRQGAQSENVEIGNKSIVWRQDVVNPYSLELFVDPGTKDHLVVGAEVNSLRQDIRYGSFRARMRSSHPSSGGSALSMMVLFDEKQNLEMDLLNVDDTDETRLRYRINENYLDKPPSTIDSINRIEPTSPISLYDFMDVRVDWIKDAVNFTVANTLTHAITSEDQKIPETPSELVLKHWSNGDATFMQGPPFNRSAANIAWVRSFFNSSLMTAGEHQRYDAECRGEELCDMDDITLRASSSYTPDALITYKEPARNIKVRIPAAIVAAICALFGFVTLTNALISRGPWAKFARFFKRKKSESLAKKPATTLPESSSVATILGPSFPFDNSSSAGGEYSRGHSFYSQSDADLFDSQGTTRGASEIEINVNLAYTEDPKPSILDDMPVGGSAQFDVDPQNNSMREKVTSIAEHRTSLTKRRILLDEREAQAINEHRSSVADGKAYLHGHRLSLSERVTDIVERKALQLAERQACSEERRASIDERKASREVQAMKELIARTKTQERKRSSVADYTGLAPQRSPSLGAMVQPTVEEKDVTDEPSVRTNPKSFDITDSPAEAMVSQQRESARKVLFKIEQPSLTNPDYALRKDKLEQSGDLSAAASNAITPITSAKKRVESLAGLVALSCLAVTFHHFALTFIPYVGGIASGQHYPYEEWARRIVTPYFLSSVWIGPFFTTSSRFLAQRYLNEGQLSDIANKMLLRAPRMLIPVIIIAMLEYFLIDQGSTATLEYLPSISWSTWPYVTKYPNFGYFINYMIELAFLIPNATPQVVSHYCMGVLWTIPVQLQNSYLVLLAVVIVKDIQTPWKRVAFYTFCILNHWYAFSWGACFWLGLLLADLDITYKWIRWIQARPRVHYPFLTLMWIITLAAPTFNLIQDRLNYRIMDMEKGWHSDPETGLPMAQTWRAGYPSYYEPRLNTLMFAGAVQVIVELSTWVQWVLSRPILTWFFPHVMTIYLIHGFVFWSLGAWLCVTLDGLGLPYWANMLIVVVVCYVVLLLVPVFITFVTEKTARAVCRNTWRWASEEPVAKLNTLFPYPKDQFLNRIKDESRASSDQEKAEGKPERTPDDSSVEKVHDQDQDQDQAHQQEKRRRPTRLQKKTRPSFPPSTTTASSSDEASQPTPTSDDFLDGLPGLASSSDYDLEFDSDANENVSEGDGVHHGRTR